MDPIKKLIAAGVEKIKEEKSLTSVEAANKILPHDLPMHLLRTLAALGLASLINTRLAEKRKEPAKKKPPTPQERKTKLKEFAKQLPMDKAKKEVEAYEEERKQKWAKEIFLSIRLQVADSKKLLWNFDKHDLKLWATKSAALVDTWNNHLDFFEQAQHMMQVHKAEKIKDIPIDEQYKLAELADLVWKKDKIHLKDAGH